MQKNIPQDITSTFERMQVLKKELDVIRKREVTENQNVSNFQSRIQRLEDHAEESLSGSNKSYEKYKTNISKLQKQLAVSREILEKLKTVRKPLDDERRTHKANLNIKLSNYIFEYRRAVDAELKPKLDSLMGDIEFFLTDCQKIFESFGIIFVERDHFIPFRIPADFLADYRRNKAAEKPIPETVSQPKAESTQTTAPDSPQAPSPEQQDAAEDSSIPTEAVSQAVEPESAVNDVVGEVPEPADGSIKVQGNYAQVSIVPESTESTHKTEAPDISQASLSPPSPEQQDVVTEPSGEESPSESTLIPSEPIPQPEAAQSAVIDSPETSGETISQPETESKDDNEYAFGNEPDSSTETPDVLNENSEFEK